MDGLRSSLVRAIQQGAPIYNAGRPADCAELYRATATSILQAGTAPDIVSQALNDAIAKSKQQGSASGAAWVMRRCFDDILDGRLQAAAILSQVPLGAADVSVLDFEAGLPDQPRWFSMDDGIMGGLSSSSLTWDPTSRAAVFQGGFASVRSETWGGYALFQKARGIRMNVMGDGRTYKLSAKTDDGYDGVMYQHDFPTVDDGRWRDVDLAFADFKPNFRGRLVPGRPPLMGAQVRQLGLMVSKFSDAGGLTSGFRTGTFRLAIRSFRGILV